MTESENKNIDELINDLESDNGIIRQIARHKLVEIGHKTIDQVVQLINSPKHMTRWEAIKTIEQMEDKFAIPILISALKDDKFDIRWIAAEGLIRIGEQSINPLMEEIIKDSDSVFIREGAHHILKELEAEGLFYDKYGIIKSLENLSDITPLHLLAKKYLK